MFKKLFEVLFYPRCEVCEQRVQKVNHFHFYAVQGKYVEDICDECIERDGFR
jgi:hypothetical protein